MTSDLSQCMLTASRVLVGVAARSLSLHEDMTVPQVRLLVLLAQRGPLRAADLAAGLSTSPSQATRLCDRLIAKELIIRETVPNDRRGVLVVLAPLGRVFLDDVTERRLVEIEQIVAAIPVERREELRAAFELFCQAAGEIPESSWPLWQL